MCGFRYKFETNLMSLDGLLKIIDPNQLTPDMEGTLVYDHNTWIELRCVSILLVVYSTLSNLNLHLQNPFTKGPLCSVKVQR